MLESATSFAVFIPDYETVCAVKHFQKMLWRRFRLSGLNGLERLHQAGRANRLHLLSVNPDRTLRRKDPKDRRKHYESLVSLLDMKSLCPRGIDDLPGIGIPEIFLFFLRAKMAKPISRLGHPAAWIQELLPVARRPFES